MSGRTRRRKLVRTRHISRAEAEAEAEGDLEVEATSHPNSGEIIVQQQQNQVSCGKDVEEESDEDDDGEGVARCGAGGVVGDVKGEEEEEEEVHGGQEVNIDEQKVKCEILEQVSFRDGKIQLGTFDFFLPLFI